MWNAEILGFLYYLVQSFVAFYLSFFAKVLEFKCHPKWGSDDLVSIPALDDAEECNKFVCFNIFDIDKKM